MESPFALNEEANRRQVLDGLKGGPLFADPVKLPPLQFKDGWQPEVKAAQTVGETTPQPKVENPFFNRRNG